MSLKVQEGSKFPTFPLRAGGGTGAMAADAAASRLQMERLERLQLADGGVGMRPSPAATFALMFVKREPVAAAKAASAAGGGPASLEGKGAATGTEAGDGGKRGSGRTSGQKKKTQRSKQGPAREARDSGRVQHDDPFLLLPDDPFSMLQPSATTCA